MGLLDGLEKKIEGEIQKRITPAIDAMEKLEKELKSLIKEIKELNKNIKELKEVIKNAK